MNVTCTKTVLYKTIEVTVSDETDSLSANVDIDFDNEKFNVRTEHEENLVVSDRMTEEAINMQESLFQEIIVTLRSEM